MLATEGTVTGEDAEPPGVDGQRLAETVLHAEIGYRCEMFPAFDPRKPRVSCQVLAARGYLLLQHGDELRVLG